MDIYTETYQGYSSHLQKHIPAKYLKTFFMKFIFLGKDFILWLISYSKICEPFINRMRVKW